MSTYAGYLDESCMGLTVCRCRLDHSGAGNDRGRLDVVPQVLELSLRFDSID